MGDYYVHWNTDLSGHPHDCHEGQEGQELLNSTQSQT